MIALAMLIGVGFPPHVTPVLGSINVTERPETCLYRETGNPYFLYAALDCDGSHVSAVLSRDRRILADISSFPTYKRRIPRQIFRGIALGDSGQKVTSTLGKPQRRMKPKGPYTVLRYFALLPDGEGKRYLINDYVLKSDRVIEVSVDWETVPGCGDTFDVNQFHIRL